MAKSQDSYRSLLRVIMETQPRPSKRSLSTAFERNFIRERIDCDEVYPGIFIGDGMTATTKEYLKSIGITHVINTAQGHKIAQVDTNEHYYSTSGIKFLGLRLMDTPGTNISVHFDECADFIDEALNKGGNVFVHCYMGISRSATIVLAYLMLRKGFTAEDAIRTVRIHRDVTPNNGFLQQLFELNIRLHKKH
uniref:Dual specificity protein phosphatase n=1 Tax=Strigamia maritima TaxID=126957 RepID=T1JBI6_STRMM